MAHSLEREIMERELRPRLCYLTKGERGYGFHLHGERTRGSQHIRKIEPGSPADLSGLRSGDRVVEVNGENVESDPHHEVVLKIKAVEHRTRLLVVDRDTDEYLCFHGLACTEDRAVEMGSLSPRTSGTSSPWTSTGSSPLTSASPSPRDSLTPPYAKEKMAAILAESKEPAPLSTGNQSPSRVSPVANGSPKYQPHQRVMSPSPLSTPPPTPEPSTILNTGLNTDLSGSDISAQETSPGDDLVMQDLRPRLCHIIMGEQGYGFNLHSNKTRVGQYIRAVDPGSPAELTGLRPEDRLVEVNDVNIAGLRHAEVVEFIRAGGTETRLLVVDPETDELFKRLGINPTRSHLTDDCVDGPIIDGGEIDCPIKDGSVSPSPTPEGSLVSPPIINVTLLDPPITSGSPRHLSNGSSSSHSTLSEMSTELSSSDNSTKVTDEEEERRPVDPFWESGLRLSPTAAEAKQRACAKRTKKRAPPMDWSKKQEIFSNF